MLVNISCSSTSKITYHTLLFEVNTARFKEMKNTIVDKMALSNRQMKE